ncbi:helix-turn-helix domain-containing protein [Longitalea arenae]|uniref:helix-turn-helix domain-containing protein n=1 Tax=Longitalea arenae TaxID=2812558 RepID=UPI001966E448|nr:helix-turn-helix domain-containing protein [Longitalea arenae]
MERTDARTDKSISMGDKVFSVTDKSRLPFKTFFYTIGLCGSGGGLLKVGTKEYSLQEGSLLTIGPGITCQWLSDERPQIDLLSFYEDLFLNIFNSAFFFSLEFFCPDAHNVITFNRAELSKIKLLFEAVHQLEETPDAVPGILFSILKLVQKQYWKQYYGNKKKLTSKEQIAANFRQLLAHRFTEHKDVSFYAKALHLTPKYLTEVLLATTGMSAKKWIEHHLMQEAKYLLAHKGLSVKEVSFRLGYVDASHFVKSFKKHEGELPKDFKQKARYALLS